ncbi:glycosyltransferase 87 family protein [Hanstruepera ponticola]|uniref:glycosyltransferase 87 family protein n=1 Tax=Hanstruepera ponticola TaxID=2042995 RepID=UPI00177E8EC0|nr:glycosyltransferase 87 family protein [Hanstruepera ponticola]
MQNKWAIKQIAWLGLYVLVSIVLYLVFAYTLERTQSLKLVLLYAGLFWSFYKLVSLLKYHPKLAVGLAFGFRALFILAIPNLSQDFYRFIWDGRMILEGFNPYLYTPQSFINQNLFPIAQAQELFNGMGSLSAGHFTNYPPLNQLCFILAGLFAGKSIWGSVLVLRLIIIAADFGTLMFGKKLLQALNLPTYNLYWYILNPFIIIELTGNLHFEGVMVFFLVWSLYLFHKHKWQWAAVVFACSVSVKLIPLLFLPLIWKHLKLKTGFWFCAIVVGLTLLSFVPFYNPQFLNNYTETVGLWFQNFEFNASLYYVFREIGFWISGYNQIAIIGKLMACTVFISVIMLGLIRNNTNTKNVVSSMLLALTVYLFLSTTVHPWYLVTLLLLSVFTHYKFPLVWSFMIVLSYLAYSHTDYSENLWIIAFEYVVVFIVFLWDLKKTKPLEN